MGKPKLPKCLTIIRCNPGTLSVWSDQQKQACVLSGLNNTDLLWKTQIILESGSGSSPLGLYPDVPLIDPQVWCSAMVMCFELKSVWSELHGLLWPALWSKVKIPKCCFLLPYLQVTPLQTQVGLSVSTVLARFSEEGQAYQVNLRKVENTLTGL